METTTQSIVKISSNDIPQYSEKDKAYQSLDNRYEGFYQYKPTLDNFKNVADNVSQETYDRKLIHRVISDQYNVEGLSSTQQKNLDSLLLPNSFTIITAHQPSLFTGPLYFIYKICSAIKLAQTINDREDDFSVIPIFISGGEDHDFEEINHAYIYGKKVEWNKPAIGPVGRLDIKEDFDAVIQEFTEIVGENNFGPDIKTLLHECLNKSNLYSEFNFHLVNQLFASYGVLVVQMDDPRLKGRFAPFMKEELLSAPSKKLVENTQKALNHNGIKSQTHVRDINLFYLGSGDRLRIEKIENGSYQIVDSDLVFTKDAILSELDSHPENFSPNVVLRPLYQESIFPNLAYIGGGGEIAYWLERKSQFKHFNLHFPMLIRRDSAILVSGYLYKQMNDLNLSVNDLFQDKDMLINQFIADQVEVEISFENESNTISQVFEEIQNKVNTIDPPLSKWVGAESTKVDKLIEQMESRLKRSIKKKEEQKVKQVEKLKDKLFPDNSLQERHDNFFQYYQQHGPALIDRLIDAFDPLENKMKVIYL